MNEIKTPKKPLIYYYLVAMLVVLLFNFLAMPWLAEHQIKDVDYNTFVSMTEKKEIGQVEIQQQSNRILFTSTDGKTIYKTAIVPDDGLVQRLLDAGISTTGEEIQQSSLLVDILGWVLPLVLFIAIGQVFPATWDWYRFLNILALLSIMLGVMNLLPIPALDGGHIVFCLYEMVTGRKPSDRFLTAAQIVGMLLLLLLMVLAFGNDIARLIR